jgi:NADH-quinone oxidoreductase subunit K
MVPLSWVLALSAALFTIGVVGVLVRRNAIVVFMSIELMLNGANVALVGFGREIQSLEGQVFVFFVLAVAAAEAAVGLALLIAMFRHRPSVNLDEFVRLRW